MSATRACRATRSNGCPTCSGIYKSLQILIPDARAADEWVRKPNAAPPFGGRSALERMLSGQVADLYVVRQYLDAERG